MNSIPQLLINSQGNNLFSYDQRRSLWSDTTLVIPWPSEITTLDQVRLGDDIVFEEVNHDGQLQSCTGLAHTYFINPDDTNHLPTIVITDNHNHLLPYRLKHISTSESQHIHLLHIDQHSDLWHNINQLDVLKIHNPQYRRDFAHHDCNIGNFITPCIDSWLIAHMTQIRTEFSLNEIVNLIAEAEEITWNNITILDIDMDFRAPEMWISDIDNTMAQVRLLMEHAHLITIATSPYFIDQNLALTLVNQLLNTLVK